MLRLVTLAAAMALGWAIAELHTLTSFPVAPSEAQPSREVVRRLSVSPSEAKPSRGATQMILPLGVAPRRAAPPLARGNGLEVEGGEPRTAAALRAALAHHGITGATWLGKLASVGGDRDTLIHVPADLDAGAPIELVIYLEGYGSFADDAMDHRHAAAMARLAGNRVYVAPDAPSSSHGEPRARTAYWQAGCALRRCAGGHAAPGDFVVFLADTRTRIAAMTGVDPDALDLRLSLVGFSNGGKGVWNAVAQLAAADFTAGGHAVVLADVVFADANYGGAWLADTWRRLAARPEAPRLTVLVGAGRGNVARAATFLRTTEPSPRLRVVPLGGGHHAIGDAAIDYLAPVGPPPAVALSRGSEATKANLVPAPTRAQALPAP